MSDIVPQKHCPRCNRDLPATTDYWFRNARKKDGFGSYCKACRSNEVKSYVTADPDYHKKRYEKYRPKTLEDQKQHRAKQALNMRNYRSRIKQPGMCSVCLIRPVESHHLCDVCRSRWQKWRENNLDHVRAKDKQLRYNLRDQVLAAYGGKCACCGETRPEFLAVDHVNEDGAAHRRILRSQGVYNIYPWLRRNGFPKEGFQLLCHNCNHAKHVYGVCPHQSDAS